jgi:hypothetical protein
MTFRFNTNITFHYAKSLSDQTNFSLHKIVQEHTYCVSGGLGAVETLFYLHEIPQTETNPKQHLENANDDGYFHLVRIHKNYFVFCYLQ